MDHKHTHDHDCGCDVTPERVDLARRRLMTGLAGAAAVGAVAASGSSAEAATPEAHAHYADPAEPSLPQVDMEIASGRTALVVTDPQIDFLSETGVTWGVVGESVTEQGTVDNIERLFAAAKAAGMPVFISPHYYYPHDHKWQFEGTLEKTMHAIGMFDRPGPLNLDNFDGSGADWMPQYKKYIEDGETVICSPHKVYGPAQNDLNLQLRKRGIDKVILGGPVRVSIWGYNITCKRPEVMKLLHDGETFISFYAAWHGASPEYRRHFKSEIENTLYHDGHVSAADTHWPDEGCYYLGPGNWGLMPWEY